MLKKVTAIFLVIFMLTAISSNVFAAEVKNVLEIVQKKSETKLTEEQGNITKEITEINAETGEVKIKLSVNNNKNNEEYPKILHWLVKN